MRGRRIVIVGAGPVGLHAALRAVQDGFTVTVLERQDVGSAIRSWSHVRLFTPFVMNSTESGRQAAAESIDLPETEQLLTGAEYVDRYLKPMAACKDLNGRILEQTALIAASRQRRTKSSDIGRAERSDSPFRLLIHDASGRENILECDILLDCTGLTLRHRFIGAGGIPCPGETECLDRDDYRIASGNSSQRPANHIVVVGSGYSAATSVCALHDVAQHITWITRGDRQTPVISIPNDSLPERATLTERSNRLALDHQPRVTWRPGLYVDAMHRTASRFCLTLTDQHGVREELECDRVVANPGFRPDGRPFEELQVHRCYATEGPMKMAAHLLGETAADCLGQTIPGPELLRNPEPDFYILGAASYGRDSRFLLQNGFEQIARLFDTLAPVVEAST